MTAAMTFVVSYLADAMLPHPLERLSLDAAELFARHPPAFRDANKKAILARVCPPDRPPRGQIEYARWNAGILPETLPPQAPAEREIVGVFAYPEPPAECFDWHLNFADPHLFVACTSSLLAQDELQALEHPALCSLLDELHERKLPARTELDDQPTPVTVAGVERRCSLDTAPDADAGRLYGLYGNRFARAKVNDVLAATTRLDPPPRSNILAIAALGGGSGRYSRNELVHTLSTATAGFSAARIEAQRLHPGARVRLHTGFWGCGAFGGNRIVMACLQRIAARIAGLDALWFYTFDEDGSRAYAESTRLLSGPLAGEPRVSELLNQIETLGYVWGQSDGN